MSIPSQTSPAGPPYDERANLHRLRGWFFVLGLTSIIVGLLAISFVFIDPLAKVIVLGVLLLVAGVTEVIHAFMVRNLRGFALHLLAATLYLIVGLFVLEDPVRAAVVLTLLLGAAFLVGGVLRVLFSVGAPFPGWPWVLFTGVVDLLLGTLILSRGPEWSLRMLGLFIGIDLLLHGWSWVILALTVRAQGTAPTAQGVGLAGPVGGAGAGHSRV